MTITLRDQIKVSATLDNLDQAVRPIQQLLGVTDGDRADMFFDDWADSRLHQIAKLDWAELDHDLRPGVLLNYALNEMIHMEFDA